MPSTSRDQRPSSPGRGPLAACAALCLAVVLAGCGATTRTPLQSVRATPLPTSTKMPTPSPMPTPALTVLQASGAPVAGATPAWQHANLPAGFGMAFHDSDLHVSASDGMTAYSCGGPNSASGPAQPQVIVTHDGGATWTRVADIPAAWGGCQSLTVDAQSPAIVVACCGGSSAGATQAISLDGGASWRLDSEPHGATILQLATRGSRTYALFDATDNSGTTTLAVSDDHLQTWRAIDTNLATSSYRTFWLNPATGAVLLEAWPGGGAFQLWTTTDDGGHWSQIAVPGGDTEWFAAQQPEAAAPWHICGSQPAGSSPVGAFVCTTDSGRTWTQEPLLVPGSAVSYGEQILALPPDGSLLATATGTAQSLYRLPPGSTRWQALGAFPAGSSGSSAYAPTASGGILWTFPAESDGAGAPDAATAVYSAPYPY